MRQLITRIDDDLHTRLKQRASGEGRSVNALVSGILARELDSVDPRGALRTRARTFKWIVHPVPPKRVPSRAVVERTTRGVGSVVSEALAAERALP